MSEVVSKYVVRLRLKQPDARVIGFFAWGRYAPIVPDGLYDQINVVAERDRHRARTGWSASTRTTASSRRQPELLEDGPAVHGRDDAEDVPDEQARVAALRAGAIDGATLSVDVARSLTSDSRPRRPEGPERRVPRAADHDQAASTKPWHDKRVRQAVNHAINRQTSSRGSTAATASTRASFRPATARGR